MKSFVIDDAFARHWLYSCHFRWIVSPFLCGGLFKCLQGCWVMCAQLLPYVCPKKTSQGRVTLVAGDVYALREKYPGNISVRPVEPDFHLVMTTNKLLQLMEESLDMCQLVKPRGCSDSKPIR